MAEVTRNTGWKESTRQHKGKITEKEKSELIGL